MAKVYEGIDGRLREFVEAQPVFFVATAPLTADGHVNLSPKGGSGTFRVVDEHTFAYLDITGSGVETIAHVRENGRVCVMLCAFQGRPTIVRLHGAGRVTRLLKLQLPAAMPAIFAGFRISAGLAVVGAIVGDLFFKQGDPGLGILLDNFRARLQGPELFLTIIIASALGFAVFLVFGWLSKLAVGRWYDQSRDAA